MVAVTTGWLGDPSVTREILGNVPPGLVTAFYVAAFLACAAAAAGFLRRLARIRRGRPEPGRRAVHASWAGRIGSVVAYLTFHRELLRDRYAGIAHLLTAYGFLVLFVGTCLVFLEHDTPLHFFYGRFYLVASLVIDLGGAAFLAGLGMFLWRRHARASGSDRILHGWRGWWVTALAWLLLWIGVTGFLLEGARIARDLPAFERWSVVGYGVALGMRAVGLAGDVTLVWHRGLWVTHAVLCLAFFALLPWRFVSHMVYGAVGWAMRTARPRGQLRAPAAPPESPVRVWADLGWSDLLQADACTTCGRCNAVCPALAAGKPLAPREVVLGLREAMSLDNGGGLAELIPDAVVWSCTTCGACNHACPVGIEVFDKLVDLRRGRVEAGELPRAATRVFDGLVDRSNPYGRPAADRLAWAAGLDVPVAAAGEPVDLLYWVGCAGSFDPDGQSVSRAMVKLLDHLGIRYRVLGRRERCTGDPARRMGEEGLFEELARHNLDTLAGHRVRTVLTHCPHCFNTFANEYPALGARFAVEHHSQFLARLITEGRLGLPGRTHDPASAAPAPITFHDPCYLGRVNGETRAPRAVLGALPAGHLVEMARSGARTFCCGAGGGALWLDVKGRDRVESVRAREAIATGAGTVATGCPFCKSMLQAGVQAVAGGSGAPRVRDLAELLVEARGL